MQNRDYFLLMHLSLLFSMSRECTQARKGRRDGGGGGLLLSRAYPEENVVMSSRGFLFAIGWGFSFSNGELG